MLEIETPILMMVIAFFVVGLAYSAIITYLIKFAEDSLVLFERRRVRQITLVVAVLFTIVFFDAIVKFAETLLPRIGFLVVVIAIGAGMIAALIFIIPRLQAFAYITAIEYEDKKLDEKLRKNHEYQKQQLNEEEKH